MSDVRPRGYASLTVHRARGLIWVCDISKSSSYINSDDHAEEFEAFLPRLHWVSSLAIDALGGEFIQWTGDGFIAWFPLAVERALGRTADRILEAVWQFSAFVNATQLCVPTTRPFRIRHALTYEPDALVTEMTHQQSGHVSKIVSGRHVVLAFRLSGIECDFPNVATTSKVEQALAARTRHLVQLKRWKPTAEQSLKHFKGEKLGTTGLVVSGRTRVHPAPADAWADKAAALRAKADSRRGRASPAPGFLEPFVSRLAGSDDQPWCHDALDAYRGFLRDGAFDDPAWGDAA